MSILKSLLDYARHLFTLTQALEQNRREIKELRQEMEQLTEVVARLAAELRYSLHEEKHHREKLLLKLENELLKHGHRRRRGRGRGA